MFKLINGMRREPDRESLDTDERLFICLLLTDWFNWTRDQSNEVIIAVIDLSHSINIVNTIKYIIGCGIRKDSIKPNHC